MDPEILREARAQFAPPDDPVFELVPPYFAQRAKEFYGEAGMPEVNGDNAWEVYSDLLQFFRDIEEEGEHETLQAEVVLRSSYSRGARNGLLDFPACPDAPHRIDGGEEVTVNSRRLLVGGHLVFVTDEEEQAVPGGALWSDESAEDDSENDADSQTA